MHEVSLQPRLSSPPTGIKVIVIEVPADFFLPFLNPGGRFNSETAERRFKKRNGYKFIYSYNYNGCV
jgi:hypothetical protein